MYKIGIGYDFHRFDKQRKLILGGVTIPSEQGLLGHSDADVLLHAITDAMLGALALGDIGQHFPDTDQAYKDADSRQLLTEIYNLIKGKGYAIENLDATVIADHPKLAPHILTIRETIARDLNCELDCIGVKATTREGCQPEGISTHAVVLLKKL